MTRRGLLALVIAALCASPTRAEHASIDLRVYHLDPATHKIKGQTSARADEEPPKGGVIPRPVLKVKAKEPLILEFVFTNTYPHGEIQDVCVRYFVARVDKIGQKTLPDLAKGAVT